ncbi:MAG TPA: TolC family protein [Gemmatimonadales bacterium]|nr:TolC family protein [Gemmatimonadales bacterium]
MRKLLALELSVIALGAATVVRPVAAQDTLRLAQALQRAEQGSYANRIAAGEASARAAEALKPDRGILPSARVEGGYVRTTDPLSAFGFTLRQRAVTPAAFAPATLNDPAATGNFSMGLVLEQPLFNADAWVGRDAAARARDAAQLSERWTRSVTAVEVVRAYWGAVLAQEEVGTLEASLNAARAHQRQAESLVAEGMATKSDALLASVKAGEVEAMLIDARSRALLAKRALALRMGAPQDSSFALPASLPDAGRLRAMTAQVVVDSGPPPERADVQAGAEALAAAASDSRRARALYLPRLNSFGRLDWNAPGTPFGGKSAWTVGVMLSWSPFSGASELAEVRAADGRRESAQAAAEAATAQASLEQEQTRAQLQVALARLDIAEQAGTQAREAHRIVTRKYDGGLAGVSELLDAAAAETAANLSFVESRYQTIVAAAERLKAEGRDLSHLLDLDR